MFRGRVKHIAKDDQIDIMDALLCLNQLDSALLIKLEGAIERRYIKLEGDIMLHQLDARLQVVDIQLVRWLGTVIIVWVALLPKHLWLLWL